MMSHISTNYMRCLLFPRVVNMHPLMHRSQQSPALPLPEVCQLGQSPEADDLVSKIVRYRSQFSYRLMLIHTRACYMVSSQCTTGIDSLCAQTFLQSIRCRSKSAGESKTYWVPMAGSADPSQPLPLVTPDRRVMH